MKTAIWILNINDYDKEIYELCVPTIERFANKLDADLNIISERKFPEWHITYEKAQVYELGKEYFWNIVMDTDILIHKDCPNFLNRFEFDKVGIWQSYSADSVFNINDYFYRDKRKIGINAGFIFASKYCHDIFYPLPFNQEYNLKYIHMRPEEIERKVDPAHFITEYWLSSNLARFGLKADGFLYQEENKYIFHTFFAPFREQKIKELKETLKYWENI